MLKLLPRTGLLVVVLNLTAACTGTAGTAIPLPSTMTVTATVTTPVTVTVTQTVVALTATVPSTKTFDERQVAAGITSVLTGTPPTGYGLSGITNVTCPAGVPVVAGTTFDCTVQIDGTSSNVAILIKDDNGLYEVSPPS